MQGPDFKVGKTDIINSNGDRVVTETKNEQTFDGKSIWTIKQEFDYDNDGMMDAFSEETKIYDKNTGKLLEEKFKTTYGNTYHEQYLYETETGRLVKVNVTYDEDSDGEIDKKSVIKYDYDEKGNLVSEKEYWHTKGYSKQKPVVRKEYEYHENGEMKKRTVHCDYNQNGVIDGSDFFTESEYDKDGNLLPVYAEPEEERSGSAQDETPTDTVSEEPAQEKKQPDYGFIPIYQPNTTKDSVRPPLRYD